MQQGGWSELVAPASAHVIGWLGPDGPGAIVVAFVGKDEEGVRASEPAHAETSKRRREAPPVRVSCIIGSDYYHATRGAGSKSVVDGVVRSSKTSLLPIHEQGDFGDALEAETLEDRSRHSTGVGDQRWSSSRHRVDPAGLDERVVSAATAKGIERRASAQ